MRVKFFADINNALNFKTFSGYGFEDIHDYDFYLSSLLLPENKLEAIGQPILPGLAHADNPGDVRPDDVGYVPIEWIGDVNKIDANNRSELAIYYDAASESYLQYDHNTGWGEVAPAYLDKVVEDKAYIDMPNQSSFIFLSPRDIFLGINISYDF